MWWHHEKLQTPLTYFPPQIVRFRTMEYINNVWAFYQWRQKHKHNLSYCAILLSNAMQFFWFYFSNPHPHPLHIFGDCVTLFCKEVRNINEKTLATYCTPNRMFSLFILIVVYFDNNWCHFLSPRKAILENILFSQFSEFLFLMDYKLNWPRSILDWEYNKG